MTRAGDFDKYMQRQYGRFVHLLQKEDTTGAAAEFARFCQRSSDAGFALPQRTMAPFFESWIDIFWQCRRPEMMLEAARLAEELFGDDPEWRYAQGEAYFYMAQFEEAWELLKALTYEDIEDPMLYFMLGCLRERQGDTAEAHKLFETANRLDPETFRLPQPMEDGEIMGVYRQAIDELPSSLGLHLRRMPTYLMDLPSTELLQAYDFFPDPLTVGLLCQQTRFVPKGERCDEEAFVLLFRDNMAKAAGEMELIEEEMRRGLFLEAGLFLGFGSEELFEMGLG